MEAGGVRPGPEHVMAEAKRQGCGQGDLPRSWVTVRKEEKRPPSFPRPRQDWRLTAGDS